MSTNMKIGIGLLAVVVIGLFLWSRTSENGLNTVQSAASATVDDLINSILEDSDVEAKAVLAETDEDGALLTNDTEELNNVNKTYNERGF